MQPRKETRNSAEIHLTARPSLLRSASSSMLPCMYLPPRICVRNITVIPNTIVNGLARASRPCHPLPQTLIVGARLAPTASLLTMKSEPVKNVLTAAPTMNGPRQPLISRKALNVFLPSRLPSFVWNS